MGRRSQDDVENRSFPVLLYCGLANAPISREELSTAVMSTFTNALSDVLSQMGGKNGVSSADKIMVLKSSEKVGKEHRDCAIIRISADVLPLHEETKCVVVWVSASSDIYGQYPFHVLYTILKALLEKLGYSVEISIGNEKIRLHILHTQFSEVPYKEYTIIVNEQHWDLAEASTNRKREVLSIIKDAYREILREHAENGNLSVYVYVDSPPRNYRFDVPWSDFVIRRLSQSLGLDQEHFVVEEYDEKDAGTDFPAWVLLKMNNVAQTAGFVEPLDARRGKGFLFIVVPSVTGDTPWPQPLYRQLYSGFFGLTIFSHSVLQVVRSGLFLRSGASRVGGEWDQLVLEVGYKVAELFGRDHPVQILPPPAFDPFSVNYIMLSPIQGSDRGSRVAGYAIYYRKNGRTFVRFVEALEDGRSARDTIEALVDKIARVISSLPQRDETVILFTSAWKYYYVQTLKEKLESKIGERSAIARMYHISPFRLRAFPIIDPSMRVTAAPFVRVTRYSMLVYPSFFFYSRHKRDASHGEYQPVFVRIYFPKGVDLDRDEVRNSIVREVLYLIYVQLAYRFANAFGVHFPEIHKLARNAVKKLGIDYLRVLMRQGQALPAYHFI